MFDCISQFWVVDHKMDCRSVSLGDHCPFSFMKDDLKVLEWV